jgi:hypothetical protein
LTVVNSKNDRLQSCLLPSMYVEKEGFINQVYKRAPFSN